MTIHVGRLASVAFLQVSVRVPAGAVTEADTRPIRVSMRTMRRLWVRLIPIVLLAVFGVALSSVALEFSDGSDLYHYDGDGDDAGHVEKVFSHDVDVVVVVSSPLFVPLLPGPWLVAVRPLRPPAIPRGPLRSRAPPA